MLVFALFAYCVTNEQVTVYSVNQGYQGCVLCDFYSEVN